jgi:SNF family Na+-dependent transporter
MAQQKQEWGSRIGVILAVSGSAVGLGNFLRFPGQAAQNGGGAFMIPYFIALLLVGIPIGWAEWTMGKYGGRKGFHSAPAIFGIWGKSGAARYLGASAVLLPMCVYFYYVMIESWCLNYAVSYATGAFTIDTAQAVSDQVAASAAFFAEATGSAADGVVAEGGIHRSVWFWLATSVINLWLIFRGVSKGIETFCRWAMPAMVVCAIIVLVRVLTLGTPDPSLPEQSVATGLNFMWNPDFSKLGDFQTWLAAAGQIFFSLSVGFGIIINYSSYMRRKDDVVLSGLTSAATNEFCEVALGGMITLTASVMFLGLLATSEMSQSSFDIGFTALPVVFARMPGGNLFGALWFFMLFLAAITSSLSMLQPTKAFFEEALGITRAKSTLLVALLALGGNLFVLWFSKGLVALDTIDFWVGSFLIFIVAGIQIILFAWVFGARKGIALANEGAQIKIPAFVGFIMKYVSPVYLIVIFIGFCASNVPDYVRTVLGDADAVEIVLPATNADSSWASSVSARVQAGAGDVPDPIRKLVAAAGEPVAVFSDEWEGVLDWSRAQDGWQTGPEQTAFNWAAKAVEPNRSAIYAWIVILSMLALTFVVITIGARRWRAQGLDLDGRLPPDDESAVAS